MEHYICRMAKLPMTLSDLCKNN